MTAFRLGINTCFAVKRWAEPSSWAAIVRDRLGLELVQHSLDLVALDGPEELWADQARAVADACADRGIEMHSTFTGLAAYSSNLLLHPDGAARDWAERWYERAIAFTAAAGGRATGGHVGALTVDDARDPARRDARLRELRERLARLARRARAEGLEALFVENLASAREPSTMAGVEALLTEGSDEAVPIVLCLDVGHQCVPGTSGDERDPYAWLRTMGARAPVVQLQQSDELGDHHWPFTARTDPSGRIDPGRVLDQLEASGAEAVALVFEIIPPFEQDDDEVLDDLRTSVERWRAALVGRG